MPAAPDSAPARCRVALCKDNAQQANPRPHALDLHHRNRTASLRRNLLMSFAALSLTIGLLLLHPLNHALHFESLTKVVVLVSLFSVGLETGPPIVRPALVVAMAMGDMLTPVAPPANGVGFLALLLRVIRSAGRTQATLDTCLGGPALHERSVRHPRRRATSVRQSATIDTAFVHMVAGDSEAGVLGCLRALLPVSWLNNHKTH